MNEAPCSWRVSTYSIDDLDTASVKRMFSSPGMPKTCVTPSFSRHSTINSAVVRTYLRVIEKRARLARMNRRS